MSVTPFQGIDYDDREIARMVGIYGSIKNEVSGKLQEELIRNGRLLSQDKSFARSHS